MSRLTGCFHIHTQQSFDSNAGIRDLTRVLAEAGMDFGFVTDHFTTRGAELLRDEARRCNLRLLAPVSAEYKTEVGDIIAAFIQEEIAFQSFADLASQVRDQQGVLVLPHPYSGHPLDRLHDVAAVCDVIEVYNSRCSDHQNRAAFQLAREMRKPMLYGADAHLLREIGNVLLEVDLPAANDEAGLKHAMLDGKFRCVRAQGTTQLLVIASQLIKTFKMRRPRLLVQSGLSIAVSLRRQQLLRPLNTGVRAFSLESRGMPHV